MYGRISESGTLSERPFADDPLQAEHFGPLRGSSLLLAVSVLVSITAILTLVAYLLAVHVEYAARNRDTTASRASLPAEARQHVRMTRV